MLLRWSCHTHWIERQLLCNVMLSVYSRRQDSSSGMSNGSSAGSTSLDELESERGSRAPSLSQLAFKSRHDLGGSRSEDRSFGSLSFKQKVLENLNTPQFEEESEGHLPLYHESGYPLATRGLLKKDLQTTSKAINLSGGTQVRYQVSVHFRRCPPNMTSSR